MHAVSHTHLGTVAHKHTPPRTMRSRSTGSQCCYWNSSGNTLFTKLLKQSFTVVDKRFVEVRMIPSQNKLLLRDYSEGNLNGSWQPLSPRQSLQRIKWDVSGIPFLLFPVRSLFYTVSQPNKRIWLLAAPLMNVKVLLISVFESRKQCFHFN